MRLVVCEKACCASTDIKLEQSTDLYCSVSATKNPPDIDITDVSEVDATPLDINDDFFDVKSALTPVAANWKDIGIALRLKHNVLDIIQAKNRGDPTACLASVVEEWLKRNYNDKFGEPTWQWLVKVVGDPAGGGNKALAKDIAREHKAKGSSKRPSSSTPSVSTRSSPRRPRGSSNQSDERTDKGSSRTPRKGQVKKPTSPPSYEEEREVAIPSFNFDFREGSDDIFVESPDTLVKKMRQQAKDKMSQLQLFLKVLDHGEEMIGKPYTGEWERSLDPLKKRGSSNKSPSSSTPSNQLAERPTDLNIKEMLARHAELEKQNEKLKASRWKTPSIPDTINQILLGQPCCLEWYKQMDEKTALLDAAIATWDGNCITKVLLFIRKTLEFNCLLGILRKRPVAVQHYCSFLKQLQAWKELSTIYRVVGDDESLAYMRLQQCEEESNPNARVSILRSCHVMFKSTPALQTDAQYVDEYAKLIDRQKRIEESATYGLRASALMFQPLTTTLLYCLRFHPNAPESNPSSPENLRKTFNISEKQFFQMALIAICIRKDWNGLDTLVTTKSVLGLGKKKKSPIGFERVVSTLANKRCRAPDDVLTRYLQEVEDLEVRLQLATEAEMFDVGIDVLRQLRDRERLGGYIKEIPQARHREYRMKIESLLSNSQIKWK